MERSVGLEHVVGGLEDAREGLHVGEGSVRDRVEVREVEHGADPGRRAARPEDVLRGH